MRRRDGGEEINFQFENFNDLMTFVGVTRPLGGFATCVVAYPQPCADAQLFKDVVSLEYLFSPERVGEASTVYAQCVGQPAAYERWVTERFRLSVSQCRNLHVLNDVEEVEELITEDFTVLSTMLYLKPRYIEVRAIPQGVSDVVTQFQRLIKPDIYGRLVQVCQFSYPSPLPLVRAILDLYNSQWAQMFDQEPYAFLKAIRESSQYRKESYTNRSYRKPLRTSQRVTALPFIRE